MSFFFDHLRKESQIEELLKNPNVTLLELLDNEDFSQDCKYSTPSLVAFLKQQEHLAQLLDLLVSDPKDTEDAHKYAILANEVFARVLVYISLRVAWFMPTRCTLCTFCFFPCYAKIPFPGRCVCVFVCVMLLE